MSKKRYLSIFAFLFVLIFSVACVFTACGKNKENDDGGDKGSDITTEEPETPGTEPSVEETVYTITVTGDTLTTGTTTDYALALGITDGDDGDVYESATLTATLFADTVAVEGAEAKWISADDKTAAVTDGEISAVAAGTTTITVTYYEEDGSTVLKSATIAVTVTDSRTTEPPATETGYTITVTGDTLTTGTTSDYALSLDITDGTDGGNDVFGSATLTASLLADGTAVEGATATWTSASDDIAKVEDGTITAVAAGTTTITVTYYDVDETTVLKSVTIAVTVTDSRTTTEPPAEETVYTITVTGDTLTTGDTTDYALSLDITDGTDGSNDVFGSATLTASLLADGTAVEGATATWISTSDSVAKVERGTITAVADGETAITVTYYAEDGTTELARATIAVTVTDSRTVEPDEPEPEPTPETTYEVTITSTEGTIYVGEEISLGATVSVNGTADDTLTVTWTVSPSDYATVDENGLLKATAAGTVTITATYTPEEGEAATASITITIKAATSAKIDFTSGDVSWLGLDGSGVLQTASKDPTGIVTVNTYTSTSSTGTVTYKDGVLNYSGESATSGSGAITIDTSAYKETNEYSYVSIKVVVGTASETEPATVVLAKTSNIVDTSLPNTNAYACVTAYPGQTETLYFVGSASTYSTVYITFNGSVNVYSIEVELTNNATLTQNVYSISLSSSTADLTISDDGGESRTLTATVVTTSGSYGEGQNWSEAQGYYWTSSNTAVATVSGSGATATITAVGAGTATITVVAWANPFKSATCTVNVTEYVAPTVKSVSTNPSQLYITLDENGSGSETLTVTVTMSDGSYYDGEVTFSSRSCLADFTFDQTNNNDGTITVNITAANRTSNFTGSVVVNAGGKTTSFQLNANFPVPDYQIEIGTANATTELEAGGETQLTVKITLDGEELADNDEGKITWSSSNENVATVDENGKVQAIEAGTTEITATYTNGDYSVTSGAVTITVTGGEIALPYELEVDFNNLSDGIKTELNATSSESNGTPDYTEIAFDEYEVLTYSESFSRRAWETGDDGNGYLRTGALGDYESDGYTMTRSDTISNYFVIDLTGFTSAQSAEIEITFVAPNSTSDGWKIALTSSLDGNPASNGFSNALEVVEISSGDVGNEMTLSWTGSIEGLEKLYIEYTTTIEFYCIKIKISGEAYVAPDTYEIKIDEITSDVYTGDTLYLTAVVTKNGEETVSEPAILWTMTEGESLAELEQDTGILNIGETSGQIKVQATFSYGDGETAVDEITIDVKLKIDEDTDVDVHLDFSDSSTYSWITGMPSLPSSNGSGNNVTAGDYTSGILTLHVGSKSSGTGSSYTTRIVKKSTDTYLLEFANYYSSSGYSTTQGQITYFAIDVSGLHGKTLTISMDVGYEYYGAGNYVIATSFSSSTTVDGSTILARNTTSATRTSYSHTIEIDESWDTLYIYGNGTGFGPGFYSLDLAVSEGDGEEPGEETGHVHNYEPYFNWASNGRSVTVTTARCTNEDGLCDALEIEITNQYTSATPTSQYKEATCTEPSKQLYTASYTYNGVTYTSECWADQIGGTAALGHDWGEYVVVTEATCTEKGSRTRTCSRCEEVETSTISALGHSYGDPEYKTAADGVTEGWCATCIRGDDEIYVEDGEGWTFTVANMTELTSALEFSNQTIMLGFDVVGSITITNAVTIDLNGHTMVNDDGSNSGTDNHTIIVANGGVLTIEDTQESGKIDNVSNNCNCAAVFVEAGGKATLAGGTYTRSRENTTGGTYYTIVNHGEMVMEDGATVKTDAVTGSSMVENGGSEDKAEMTINGGKFESSSSSMIKNDVNGKLVITGGEFTGNGTTAVILNCAELEISGGTFKQTATGEDVSNLVVWNYENSDSSLYPTAKISGGTFSGGTTATIYNDANGTMTISEGSFDNAENATVISEGTLTIDGGTFTSSGTSMGIYLVWAYSGTLTINGGIFTAGDATDYAVVASAGTAVAINGGTFGGTDGVKNLWAGTGSSITVYGGTFTEDPSTYVGDDYYAATDETDGLWHVQANDWAIEIVEQNVTVTAGEETSVTVKIYLNGTETDAYTGTVSWSSSDNDIATVDENGTVKTIAQGEVTVTAAYAWGDGKRIDATIKIYIEPAAGEAKIVTADFTVDNGWSTTLSSDTLSSAGSAGVALDIDGILKYVNTYPQNPNGMAYYIGWTTVNDETCIQTGNYNKYGATVTPTSTSGKSNYFVIDTTGYTSISMKVDFSLIANANGSGAATSGELGVTKTIDAVSNETNSTSATLSSPLAKASTGTTANSHVTLEYTCDEISSLGLTDGLLYICYTTSLNIYSIEIAFDGSLSDVNDGDDVSDEEKTLTSVCFVDFGDTSKYNHGEGAMKSDTFDTEDYYMDGIYADKDKTYIKYYDLNGNNGGINDGAFSTGSTGADGSTKAEEYDGESMTNYFELLLSSYEGCYVVITVKVATQSGFSEGVIAVSEDIAAPTDGTATTSDAQEVVLFEEELTATTMYIVFSTSVTIYTIDISVMM